MEVYKRSIYTIFFVEDMKADWLTNSPGDSHIKASRANGESRMEKINVDRTKTENF